MLPHRRTLTDVSPFERRVRNEAFVDELSKIAKKLTRREKLKKIVGGGTLVAGGTLAGHLAGAGVEKLIDKRSPRVKKVIRYGTPALLAGLAASKLMRDRLAEKYVNEG
jgi:hypothetical protein